MKTFLISIILGLFSFVPLNAQSLYFGLRDNQYIQFGFFEKHHWFIVAEHSVFSTQMKNQSVKGYLGYDNNYQNLDFMVSAYGGIQYNNAFNTYGGCLEASYRVTSWFDVIGGLRPHYDSYYDYTTCFKAGLSFKVYKEVSLFGEYTNYPEYRICEDKIIAGVNFRVKNLWVSPEVSIPVNDAIETTRFLISFGYHFNL